MLSKYYYYVYGRILWMAASGLRLIQKVITFCVILAVACLLLHCLDSAWDNESFFGAEVSPGLKKKDRML